MDCVIADGYDETMTKNSLDSTGPLSITGYIVTASTWLLI